MYLCLLLKKIFNYFGSGFNESTRSIFSYHPTSMHKWLSDQTSNQLQEEIRLPIIGLVAGMLRKHNINIYAN